MSEYVARAKNANIEIAKNMLLEKLPIETIIRITKLTKEQIDSIEL